MEGTFTRFERLKAHIKACKTCTDAGGLDAAPVNLCFHGNALERLFDEARHVRAPWEKAP